MTRIPFHLVLGGLMSCTIATFPPASRANVFPTNLNQSSGSLNTANAESVTLGYLLNEAATNVSVEILNSSSTVVRTISAGAQTKGANSVIWDGKDDSMSFLPDGNYSFRVTSAGDNSRTAWTLISTDTTLNNFFTPRGVAVNKNPNSPYYGRVYITEGAGGNTTAAGRAVSDGVYMLNADFSDAGGVSNGSIAWTTSANSPWQVEVGPDDSVYVTDWTDGHSGLWQAGPTLAGTWTEVLDNTGRAGSGLNATHGSISDVVITGTGASRTIYTTDEDFLPSGGSTGSVPRYDIGETTTFTGAPSGFAYVDGTGTADRVINFQDGLARDIAGNFWLSQSRFNGTDQPTLFQIDPSGAIIWNSFQMVATPGTDPDPLRGAVAIAYDEVNQVLAVVTATVSSTANIHIFDPASKTIVNTFAFGTSSNNTAVAFDDAGNLYVANRGNERVRIFAPNGPLGWTLNQFGTDSLGPLGSITLTSAAGVAGDHDGDGDVDVMDYVVWRAGDPNGTIDPQGYIDWTENYGNPPGAGHGGVSAAPEPSTVLLTLLGLLVPAFCRRGRR